ncbi:hypothetical protein QBC36DRAFT_286823 [Triangularia setosa]|uniref:Uncharacterized protein n=1 Tax=Triangularia setosa TaxID=2587417 RepID=A0AAN6WEQ2_9PEZI|nr:hypothetical protein QBC36DRAFT_286823 [Podospora setosa]
MSVNKRKVTTISGICTKLDRYCCLVCEANLPQGIATQLLLFLKTEREEAAVWKKAVTDQFPEWFDLPCKKEDVPQSFLKDWEIMRELGWVGDPLSSTGSLPIRKQRQRESTILPDTQLERLVAVNILVESLVKERLKEEKSIPSYRCVDRWTVPPFSKCGLF